MIDSLAWEGDKAIGETAFWLKVLSTPQTDFLKQQKKLFKLAIAEQCSQIYRTYVSIELVENIARHVLRASVKAGTEGCIFSIFFCSITSFLLLT